MCEAHPLAFDLAGDDDICALCRVYAISTDLPDFRVPWPFCFARSESSVVVSDGVSFRG